MERRLLSWTYFFFQNTYPFLVDIRPMKNVARNFWNFLRKSIENWVLKKTSVAITQIKIRNIFLWSRISKNSVPTFVVLSGAPFSNEIRRKSFHFLSGHQADHCFCFVFFLIFLLCTQFKKLREIRRSDRLQTDSTRVINALENDQEACLVFLSFLFWLFRPLFPPRPSENGMEIAPHLVVVVTGGRISGKYFERERNSFFFSSARATTKISHTRGDNAKCRRCHLSTSFVARIKK